VDGEEANAKTILTDGCTIRCITLTPSEEPMTPGEGEIKVRYEVSTPEMLFGYAIIAKESITFEDFCIIMTEGEMACEEFFEYYTATVNGKDLTPETVLQNGDVIYCVYRDDIIFDDEESESDDMGSDFDDSTSSPEGSTSADGSTSIDGITSSDGSMSFGDSTTSDGSVIFKEYEGSIIEGDGTEESGVKIYTAIPDADGKVTLIV